MSLPAKIYTFTGTSIEDGEVLKETRVSCETGKVTNAANLIRNKRAEFGVALL